MSEPDQKDDKTTDETVVRTDKSGDVAGKETPATPSVGEKTAETVAGQDKVAGEVKPENRQETGQKINQEIAGESSKEIGETAKPAAQTKSAGMPPLRREEPPVAAPRPPVVEAPTSTPAPAPARKPVAAPKQTTQPKALPAPPRKKRRDGTLSAMSGFLSFLLVVLVAGAFGVIAMMHKLKEPGPLAQDKIVFLPSGSDTAEMISILQREGVIDNPSLMNYTLLFTGARNKLKPGEYLFKTHVSLRDAIDEMIAGRQVMHSFTVPEGLTSEQIVQRLRENDMLAGDILETPKEGALLPDTFKFPRGFPRARLISKMQEDQRKLVEQIWAKRDADLPIHSARELVILASIVEKETGKAEERPRVAAVFVNRLRKHMRLQSDPTIIYGLVGGKGALGRGILRSEIEKFTPYNTYTIDGLPPGPIANPGRAALEATAHPAATDDLYFVADGTGGHVFANSLANHSRNVQQWRRIEQDNKTRAGETPDRTTPGVSPPATPKNDKRTEAPIGRLINLARAPEEYPAGRGMAADAGATHRIGVYGPTLAAFVLGGYDDPSEPAASDLHALRPARPFFSEDVAQPRTDPSRFEADLLASANAGEGGGDNRPDMAEESPDGRALPDEPPEVDAYPVSPARRAEQKARAARLGLAAGSDDMPTDALGEKDTGAPSRPETASAGPLALASGDKPMRPRAFDASEGTALDPLKDKSWDLSSAKTVPATASLH
jgi:UPF0755 protein